MEQLRVAKLLASALAAVTAAVAASFFGVDGTLIGAALGSVLVVLGEALYARSLASAHTLARRSLIRRVGQEASASEDGAGEDGAGTVHPRPLRWRRVAVAAVLAFGIAVGVITGVEAVARQPLASLVGSRQQQGASTSLGVVVAGEDGSASPVIRAPATSTTSPPGSAPTTTVPGVVATTGTSVATPTTTAPAGTVPSTTGAATTTPSSPTLTTGRP